MGSEPEAEEARETETKKEREKKRRKINPDLKAPYGLPLYQPSPKGPLRNNPEMFITSRFSKEPATVSASSL